MQQDITPVRGLKVLAGSRALVVEHVDDEQVYYAIHDDNSRSAFPARHRIQIAQWFIVIAQEIDAGRARIAPNAEIVRLDAAGGQSERMES